MGNKAELSIGVTHKEDPFTDARDLLPLPPVALIRYLVQQRGVLLVGVLWLGLQAGS